MLKTPSNKSSNPRRPNPTRKPPPASCRLTSKYKMPAAAPQDDLIDRLQQFARRRKYAIKLQYKIDRALESFVRRNFTDWEPNLQEKERAVINRNVADMIDQARAANSKARKLVEAAGKTQDETKILQAQKEAAKLLRTSNLESTLLQTVELTDNSRGPADTWRADAQSNMEKFAAQLPVANWIESIPGVGMLGLAQIVAETGDLNNYANPGKVWKRLGYAPYDGYAGSTWKRESWRPRKLEKDEWVAAPFSGERYASMYTLSLWLINKQWISAKKSGTSEGRPDGPYGEIYAARRAHTLTTHPDWSDGHRRADGLRIAFKRFLADLWATWTGKSRYSRNPGHIEPDIQICGAGTAAAGQAVSDTHSPCACGGTKIPGQSLRDDHSTSAGIAAAGQPGFDIQGDHVCGGTIIPGQDPRGTQVNSAGIATAGQRSNEHQLSVAGGGTFLRTPGHVDLDAQMGHAGIAAAGQPAADTQKTCVRGGTQIPGQRSVETQGKNAGTSRGSGENHRSSAPAAPKNGARKN